MSNTIMNDIAAATLNPMTAKQHYDHHLAKFYSWMVGDFSTCVNEFAVFLKEHKIAPASTKKALDLGAGHGVQSLALANAGFQVTAVDFNQQLLEELRQNANGMEIETVEGDIRTVARFREKDPELVICYGDTLTHLGSMQEVEQFISDIAGILKKGNKFLLSFRDYSIEETGTERSIAVKSDHNRTLTCNLHYESKTVIVTDVLEEKSGEEWMKKTSSYKKLRIVPGKLEELMKEAGFRTLLNSKKNGLITIIAERIKFFGSGETKLQLFLLTSFAFNLL